jgi:hypothetical protein
MRDPAAPQLRGDFGAITAEMHPGIIGGQCSEQALPRAGAADHRHQHDVERNSSRSPSTADPPPQL